MKLIPYFPKPPLSRFVELIWSVKGTSAHTGEKVLPNGAVELIINLGSFHKLVNKEHTGEYEVYRKSWIAGVQTEYIVIEPVRETDLFGIRFRPGGARAFFGFPITDITNRVFEANAVFGRSIDRLREKLLEADTYIERIRVIERFLLKRIHLGSNDRVIDHVLHRINSAEHQVSIRALSRDVGLSNKHLINRFRNVVGVPPKLLFRILRFQSVIDRVKDQQKVLWADIAQQCNYYDQAHMIRDFRIFCDASPSQYLRHRDDDENHIIIE